MLVTVVVCAAALLLQDKPAEKKPEVDRSAEPALKMLFDNGKALRNAHIEITYYDLELNAGRYNQGSFMNIWLGDRQRYRLDSSDHMWGGGKIIVSDGSAMLEDELNDYSPIKISKATKPMYEANDQEALCFFLEGKQGFEKLVEAEKPIKFRSTTEGLRGIEFTAKKLGKLVVYYREKDVFPFPFRIESFRSPWWDATYEGSDPMNREVISVVKVGPMDPSLFLIKAPKGLEVVDERQKKPGATLGR